MKTESSQEPGKNRTRVVTVICVVVLVLMAVLLVLLLHCCTDTSVESRRISVDTVLDGVLDQDDPDAIRAALQKKVDESKLAIKINANPVFNRECTAGNVRIENPPENRYNMVVVITLDETGDTIYISPVIQPNQYLEYIRLPTPLEPGAYPATATFQAIDDNQEPMGKVMAGINIVVQ